MIRRLRPRESGVRHLEKLLQKIARKAVVKLLENPNPTLKITVKARKTCRTYFGRAGVPRGTYFTRRRRR